MRAARVAGLALAACLLDTLAFAGPSLTPEGLDTDFKMEKNYEVSGANWSQVANNIRYLRDKVSSSQGFEGVTFSKIELEKACTADTARIKVTLIVSVPYLSRESRLADDDQQCWAGYDRGLTDHEEGHVQIAVHDGEETLAAIRASRGATCGDLKRLVAQRADAMAQDQVQYDAASEHGLVQWRAWGLKSDPDPDRAALAATCSSRARAQSIAQ